MQSVFVDVYNAPSPSCVVIKPHYLFLCCRAPLT